MKRTFRVKRSYRKILRNRKARIERRLAPRNWTDQPRPMLQGGNLSYEMAERAGAVGCGGLGVMHNLAQRLGLVKEIDDHLELLKVHLPYHESDHALNTLYMVMAALAWNLKAWFAMLVPDRERGLELLKMEFRSFLQAILLLPCQIVRRARQIVWRIQSYSRWLKDLFATFERVLRLELG